MNKLVPAPAAILLNQIGKTEAPKGYNTVYNNKMSKMTKPLTQMTFDEVVADGPRRTREFGSSACGRYQFMRDTLDAPKTTADLKGEMGLTGSELFSADLQDLMGLHLLRRRGYDKYMSGRMSRSAFGNQLAMEWASYPVLSNIKGAKRSVKRGQTYYAGDGLNKVLIKPEEVEAVLDQMKRVSGIAPEAPPEAVVRSDLPNKPGSLETAVAPSYRPSVGGALAGLWSRLGFGKPQTPAAKFYKGDPVVYAVQEQMQQRGYYVNGILDGDPGKTAGSKTRTAINAMRADNGMPPGYIDKEFLARLPTFGNRPVSKIREQGDFATAKAYAPDLTAPVGYLWKAGAGLLGLGGIDAAATNGLIGQAQQTIAQGQGVIGEVQGALTTVGTALSMVYEYRYWIIIALGLYLLARAASFALDIVHKFKRAII